MSVLGCDIGSRLAGDDGWSSGCDVHRAAVLACSGEDDLRIDAGGSSLCETDDVNLGDAFGDDVGDSCNINPRFLKAMFVLAAWGADGLSHVSSLRGSNN